MNALRDEMAKKKQALKDQKTLAGPRKYIRRGELEKMSEMANIVDQPIKEPLISISEITQVSKKIKISHENINEATQLARAEVIRRLRERAEPISLYGETFLDSFKRLRQLEILEPEINRGFRNDFQEALEKVDRAYLNEIIKSSNEKHNIKNVPLLIEEQLTIDDVKLTSESLPSGGSNELKCKMVHQFIQLILQLWDSRLDNRPEAERMSVKGKLDSATYTQTTCYLKPLTKRLKTRSLPEDILESLCDIVLHCLDRDYVKANDSYLQMAIGNAPWPIGVTMVGIHARTGREKIFSKHVAHVLNDETQRKYIQGLKRLITKCQYFFTAAPSKCVEYQAANVQS